MSRFAALALVAALAIGARAEIYRCPGPDGSPGFSSDPSRCPGAVVHSPDPDRVQVPTPEAVPDSEDATAPPAAAVPVPDAALSAMFAPVHASDWEVLREPPAPARDPDLVAQGLRSSVARHYTRYHGPISEVCTLEIWSFAGAAQAAGAGARLDQPKWWKRAAGSVLVLAHGVRLERRVGSRSGLVAGCAELAEATHARAASRR